MEQFHSQAEYDAAFWDRVSQSDVAPLYQMPENHSQPDNLPSRISNWFKGKLHVWLDDLDSHDDLHPDHPYYYGSGRLDDTLGQPDDFDR